MSIFHRHRWTDWLVTDMGDTLYAGRVVGWYMVQQRHCLTCGKIGVADKANYGGNGASYCTRRPGVSAVALRKDGVRA